MEEDQLYPGPGAAQPWRPRKTLLSEIRDRLSPVEVQVWVTEAWPQIEDAIKAIAQVDGIDAARKAVRELYLSWLTMGRTGRNP